MFSLCGGIGPLVALLALPYLGPRKTVGVGGRRRPRQLRDADGVRLRLLHHGAERGAGVRGRRRRRRCSRWSRCSGCAARSAWPPASGSRAHTAWRDTFVRLGARRRRRLLPAPGRPAARSAAAATTRAASTTSRGSCRSSATCGRSIEAPASSGDAEPVPARGGWRAAAFSAAPVFLIPLIGFGLLRVQPIGDPGRLGPAAADGPGDGGGARRADAAAVGPERRAAARRRAAAAAGGRDRADRGPDPDHARERRRSSTPTTPASTRSATRATSWPRRRSRDLLERGFERMVDHVGTEVRQKGIWRGTLVHRRKDGTTFPASSTVVALQEPRRPRHPLRRRRARHHRRAEAARSARAQRAALGDRRARGRRGARDQQPAPDDHRLRRADDRGAARPPASTAISRWSGRRRRAPGRSSATCSPSSAAARPIGRPPT